MGSETRFDESQQQLQSLLRDVMRAPLQEYQGELVATIEDIEKQVKIVPISIEEIIKQIPKSLRHDISQLNELTDIRLSQIFSDIIKETTRLCSLVQETNDKSHVQLTDKIIELYEQDQYLHADIISKLTQQYDSHALMIRNAQISFSENTTALSKKSSDDIESVNIKVNACIWISILNIIGLIVLVVLVVTK